MKGPYARYKYSIAREWVCPRCGVRVKTPGEVTTLRCPCRAPDETVWMRLWEPQPEPAATDDDAPPPA